ncbi:hypothetical protein UPYG_G00130640 [Umbra pygmaea]|uniref:Uncharacterized protein n=1 Tax=Umbra pygmaea TaxID=75934 RepID=A0ABD0XP35_UMBPY
MPSASAGLLGKWLDDVVTCPSDSALQVSSDACSAHIAADGILVTCRCPHLCIEPAGCFINPLVLISFPI